MKPLDKIFTKIVNNLAKLSQRVKLILTEGESSLIQKVADHLTQYNITPILLLPSGGDKKASITNPNVILKTIHDFDLESLANQLFQLRKNKITLSQAQALIKNRSYLATMLLKTH